MINCPGYGARALCSDESVTPVRGQIGWLIPQPEVNYGLYYSGVSMLSRRDGIVVQALWGGDMSATATTRGRRPRRDRDGRWACWPSSTGGCSSGRDQPKRSAWGGGAGLARLGGGAGPWRWPRPRW